ncbi:MAG: peptidoglycan DD-metalloendopeptidase family protein [Bacteroidetes bacterium]|nr:peptidoglycan DD-metalloendopeptidase family protein [Bacteroidota bacterium]
MKTYLKKFVLIGTGLLTAALGIFLLSQVSEDAVPVEPQSVRPTQLTEVPSLLFGMDVKNLDVVEEMVRPGKRFADLLDGHYVSPTVTRQLNTLTRAQFDFRKIVSGRKYTLLSERDSAKSLQALIYEPSATDYFIFHLKDSFKITEGHREVTMVEKQVAGVIGSSLSETINTIGLSHELTNRFVDIFAWQIDFQMLQKGDRFKLIYEEKLVDALPVGIGRILGIYFEHFGNVYYAIPFDQGEGLDYFDERGNSLRKALLKYPIEFTRISSGYTHKRFHPILKSFTSHPGIDFVAALGTPIRSVGDGIVLEAQYKGWNGNYVKIRHNDTYSTQYLHMSRIAEGVRPGVRVRQGEVIGFVGSTGLSTGPHLCYRFWKNGIQVDPLRVELPPSQPVKEEQLGSFELTKLDVQRRLNRIFLPEPPVTMVAY